MLAELAILIANGLPRLLGCPDYARYTCMLESVNERVGLEFAKVFECRLTCEIIGKYRFVYNINVYLAVTFITFRVRVRIN